MSKNARVWLATVIVACVMACAGCGGGKASGGAGSHMAGTGTGGATGAATSGSVGSSGDASGASTGGASGRDSSDDGGRDSGADSLTTGAGGATAPGVLGDGSQCSYTGDKQFCACVSATCGGDTLKDETNALRSIYCGQCGGGTTCIGRASSAGGAVGICEALKGLTPGQKLKAAGLTSVWENSTPTLQYGFCGDIGDGRGYTAGRAGFCTGTGDAIVVVQCFAAAKPGNPLERFIPELIRLEQMFVSTNGELQGDISGLQGYKEAWMSLGNDAMFRACQDSAVDAIYYGAALKKATDKKFTGALTIVSLWDGQIMHGESDPNFGMLAMMAQADKLAPRSDPPTDKQESDWLGAFHKIRAQVMTTRDEWRPNIYRVATYEELRRAGNMAFTGCVQTGGVSGATYWPGLPGNTAPSFNVCGD